jgi:hypothetical protein
MAYASPLPPAPTAARPGSHEKVAVLEARAAAGYALWHPADSNEPAAVPASERIGVGPMRYQSSHKRRERRVAG